MKEIKEMGIKEKVLKEMKKKEEMEDVMEMIKK
jgi:hypothetical protein